MALYQVVLLAATFLCALVAGFLFAFAVVAMPGLRRLDDGAFIRAFQVMDRVIQNNQPLFLLVWVGSVLLLILAAVLGFGALEGMDRWLLVGATLLYVFGVQAPTIAANIPLNNRIQAVDVAAADAPDRAEARAWFEARWNRWNRARTVVACLVTALLIVLVFRL